MLIPIFLRYLTWHDGLVHGSQDTRFCLREIQDLFLASVSFLVPISAALLIAASYHYR